MATKIIDLSHILNDAISVYPGTVGPKFETLSTVEKDGFNELKMTLVLHSGTHIDAPYHVLKNARSIDQITIDKFIGKAIVIRSEGQKDIGLEYLRTFEERISKIDFILFYTGWQHKWKTKRYYDNCPTITREAATWLTKFKLKGIGIDSFSTDDVVPSQAIVSEGLPNHHIFLQNEIILIENLTNLDKLPDNIFTFQCFPLNIENADGSPVRAIAIIEE
jgi:arylformamidase